VRFHRIVWKKNLGEKQRRKNVKKIIIENFRRDGGFPLGQREELGQLG
jgi:hypothetical protein